MISRIRRKTKRPRYEIEQEVLTSLIINYRSNVRTFEWNAIREVIIDRLEGSRRSIRGHEKEAVVRKALLIALQRHFSEHHGYGIYGGVEISEKQVMIGNESYDVNINLLNDNGEIVRKILVPIKTRETEGGGHSHLFSRDILSAISTARMVDEDVYMFVIIVAKNWATRESDNLDTIVDHLVVFDQSPGDFTAFSSEEQQRLYAVISAILEGTILPKSGS